MAEQDQLPIVKRYAMPDGSILELTQEEFDRVVDVFKLLSEQDKKLKAMQQAVEPS